MNTSAPGKYSLICRQLWKEQRDQITNIHAGASRGDRRSQALLAHIETYNTKLQHLEELGKFVAEKEAADATRN